MRNGCGLADWGSKMPMFDETEHSGAISWRGFRDDGSQRLLQMQVDQNDQNVQ